MADDAFALSPISARAAQPSDEDYGAICEAFMETARGRWFLNEYAKRNRNSDTRAVLDAVARIEDTLARQKPQAEATEPEIVEPRAVTPDPRIQELEQRLASLTAEIRDALDAARRAMPSHEPRINLEEALAPLRHAGQMVQGVAWTLRESGADGRICTLLDQQAKSIATAMLHPAFDRATSDTAPDAAAANVLAALEDRIKPLLEQDGLTFDFASILQANPSKPKIIVPNDDFEIVDHIDHAASDVSAPIGDDGAGVQQPAIGTQDAVAPHHAASPLTVSSAAATHLDTPNLDTALFDDAPAAQQIQNPAAAVEPVTLGAVIADAALKATSSRAHADPLAPFARMTKAERNAFFS